MLHWPGLDLSDKKSVVIKRDILPALQMAELEYLLPSIMLVFNRWNEPWRHYHWLGHCADILRKAMPILETLPLHWRRVLVLAIIFHDVVLLPGAKTNEFYSSVFAKAWLDRHHLGTYTRDVSGLVLNSQFHMPILGDAEFTRVCRAFLDLDLSSFGGEPKQVARNGDLLFKEMCDTVTEKEFRDGQWSYIDDLRKRRGTPFYHSPEFEQFSPAAERNIELILSGKIYKL